MTIKIPSHNIYDIPKNDILRKNRITKSTITSNLMGAKTGSLLPQEEYVFNITKGLPFQGEAAGTNLEYYKEADKNNGVQFGDAYDNPSSSNLLKVVTGVFTIDITKNVLDKNISDFIVFNIETDWVVVKYLENQQGFTQYAGYSYTSDTPNSFVITGICKVLSRNENSTQFQVELTLPYMGKIDTDRENVSTGEISSGYDEYWAQKCRVSLVGEYVEIVDGEIISVGDGNEVFKNETNELVQIVTETPNWDKDRYWNGYLQRQIDNYKDGKQIVELVCDINDYYDYDTGEKVLSATNPQLIPLTSKVIPFIPSGYGSSADVPLAQNIDGTPKQFIVLSCEPYFDGALLQKIYLQEV